MTNDLTTPVFSSLAQLTARERATLLEALRDLWSYSMGREVASLELDLEALRRWFDPVAQGGRLRKDLAELEPMPLDWSDPGAPYSMPAGHNKYLITPEGRCAVDLLARYSSGRELLTPLETDSAVYERVLMNLYRRWSRHRIDSVVALLEGKTKPLQIAAAGVLITLLVNRCTDESRAMIRFPSGPAREVVDGSFFASVDAFTSVLAPRRRMNSDPRLISGWMLYEAGRRVGDGLVLTEGSTGEHGKVWIKAKAESHIIQVITRDLVRGQRARATHEGLTLAFDSLVVKFRYELPRLASFGLAFERPTETHRLRMRLLASLDEVLEDPT